MTDKTDSQSDAERAREWITRARHNGLQHSDIWPNPWRAVTKRLAAEFAAVRAEAMEAERDHAYRLALALEKVVDRDLCRLDHHGHCQTHGMTSTTCWMANARSLLAAHSARERLRRGE